MHRNGISTSNGGGMLVHVVSGPRGTAAINHYLDAYRSTTALALTPTSLINFGEAVNFPLIFGAMLAVVGAATLAHLLVVSVARRRREIGLLKVLGFVNRQVASAVAWQATTIALIGIIIGVPLGVAAGAGDMECVRQQPRRCPGLRRADMARGSFGGGCRRSCESPRHRPCAGGDPVEAGKAPAGAPTQRCMSRQKARGIG